MKLSRSSYKKQNIKLIEGNFCTIARKKSATLPQFHPLYIFLEISLNQGFTLKNYKKNYFVYTVFS